MKQIDLWGNDCEIVQNKTGNHRRERMQEQYGVIEGKTCKTCKHCVKYTNLQGNRNWYKCEKWVVTSCSATDIRLKDKACGKYEEDEE